MSTKHCTRCGHACPDEALFCSQCGSALHRVDQDPLIGQTVAGRYHLVERIGQGGAGTLYRAEHVTLRRRMAVKLLHHQLSVNEEAVERFRREAITVCEIDNDHILQVHDFGKSDDGRLFFAMEYLEGEPLSAVVEREGRLAIERTCDIMGQIADALMEAHALGYVHRDLRPRNVFLTRRRGRADFVKLLDFGLAKLILPDVDAAKTNMGMTFGDPHYMAPEQARGEVVDRRADLYSLGALGYEMLVGQPPYKGAGTFDVLGKVLDAPVPRICDKRPDCPEWLEAVVRVALAKSAADRFATVAQLLEALERKQVLEGQPPFGLQVAPQGERMKAIEQMAPMRAPVLPAAPATSTPDRVAVPARSVTRAYEPVKMEVPQDTAVREGQGASGQRLSKRERRQLEQERKSAGLSARGNSGEGDRPEREVAARELADKAAREAAEARHKAEREARQRAEEEIQEARAREETRHKAEEEARQARAKEEARRRAEEETRRRAEEAKEEARRKSEEAQRRSDQIKEEARRQAQERAEQEALQRQEAHKRAEQRAALEAQKKAELEARRRAEEAEEEARQRAEEEARQRAEEARKRAEEKAEAARLAAEQEAQRAEEAVRQKAEREAQKKTEKEAQKKAEQEARQRKEAQRKVESEIESQSRTASGRAKEAAARIMQAARDRQQGSSDEPAPIREIPREATAPMQQAASYTPEAIAKEAAAWEEAAQQILNAPAVETQNRRLTGENRRIIVEEATMGRPIPIEAALPIAAADGDEEQDATRPVPMAFASGSVQQSTAPVTAIRQRGAAPLTDSAKRSAAPLTDSAKRSAAPFIDEGEKATGQPETSTVAAAEAAQAQGGQGRATGEHENLWFDAAAPASAAVAPVYIDDEQPLRRRMPVLIGGAVAGVLMLAIVVVAVASQFRHSSGEATTLPGEPGQQAKPADSPATPVEKPVAQPVTPPKPEVQAVAPTPTVPQQTPKETAPPPIKEVVASPVKEVAPPPVKEGVLPPVKAVVAPVVSKEKPTPAKEKVAPPVPPVRPAAKPVVRPVAVAKETPKETPKETKDTKRPVMAAKDKDRSDDTDSGDKRSGENAAFLIQLGRQKLQSGDVGSAGASFAKAHEVDPKSPEALAGLGEVAFEQGNWDDAIRNLRQAIRLSPRKMSYQVLLGQSLYKLGRYKDAADVCSKALRQDPSLREAQQTLDLAQKKLSDSSDSL